MKLKLQQILSAIPAMQKLRECTLEGYYLFDFIAVTQKIQPYVDDFRECNSRIIERHGGKANKNGKIEFETGESEQAANIEYWKLVSKEIDMEFEKAKLPVSKNIRLSAADVELLSPFVEFFREDGADKAE